MRYKIYTAILFTTCTLFFGCAPPKQATGAAELTAAQLLPLGRTALTDRRLELISSAAHFGFSFSGTECRIYATLPGWQDHNYIQYEMDGVYQKRIRINKSFDGPIVIKAAGEGVHTVTIYKATEAHTGPVFIEKIAAAAITPVANSTAPLIEFIGNSITCGAAADDSETPCGTGDYHDQHNAYLAYGPRTARALKANYLLSAVSGIGVYRNWNSNGPAMPAVYTKTDFQQASTRQWDFSLYTPEVVSIALGTNDFSTGDGKHERPLFDSAAFVQAYITFVQMVQSKYPSAQIALLSSAMVSGDKRILLQNCLAAVKQQIDGLHTGNKPLALYFFKPMRANGCSGHPSVKDHAVLADELIPFFKKLLYEK